MTLRPEAGVLDEWDREPSQIPVPRILYQEVGSLAISVVTCGSESWIRIILITWIRIRIK